MELRIDGTGVQVRRPRANKPGRRAFVSGKKKMNTKKATVVTDEQGRTLWAGAYRPGRMHDQTAVRTEGIADLFEQFPQVRAKVDAGYRGLAKEFPDQVQAPPLKPKKDAASEETAAYEENGTGSPPSGSASSTQTQSTSSGGPSSGTSDRPAPSGSASRSDCGHARWRCLRPSQRQAEGLLSRPTTASARSPRSMTA
ncbi:MAG: hypothetical protein JWM19_2508 [Actinomycetia bacterium]|nr:hypothetical protein [Actinomycetes bacterium]